MELDAQFLNELLEFLRILKDVDLPAKFQKIRERLAFRVQTAAASASGNYIHMKPGKPIEYDSSADNSSAEYVAPGNDLQVERTLIDEPKKPPPISDSFLFSYRNEKQRVSNSSTTSSFSPVTRRPPTYLVVENPPSPTTESVVVAGSKITEIPKDEETQDSLVRTYAEMNSFEAEDRALIFGQLKRKEKRLFFETLRAYWAALVGYHLLTYGNRNDPSPSLILSLRGCTCNPVSSSPRNAKKQSETVFEICCTDRTIQFTAPAAEKLEEWVAAIRQAEANSRDVADVDVNKETSGPDVIQEESSGEEYEDVITNIPELLRTPNNKANKVIQPKRTPGLLPAAKPKLDVPKPPIHQGRSLPAPPTPESEGSFYNDIESSDKCVELDYSIPTEAEDDQAEDTYDNIDQVKKDAQALKNKIVEETYDDIGVVNREAGKELRKIIQDPVETEETYDDVTVVKKTVGLSVAAENVAKELKRRITPEPIEIEEAYDDAEIVKKDAEKMRQNGNIKKLPEVDKKPIPESPRQMRTSPMNGFRFFNKLRMRNNSPQKGEEKKKTPNSKEKHIEETNSCNKEQIPIDQIYKNPPIPIPVHNASDDSGDQEESIYDDVTMKVLDKSKETRVDTEAEKQRRADMFVAGLKPVDEGKKMRPLPVPKPQKNVVRNLNKSFEQEIYQNQSSEDKIDDSIEHYQVPRGNLQTQYPAEVEDETEQIYDDAAIAAQKKREVEESKQNPVVARAMRNKVPVLPKPSDKSLINKLHKLKPSPEKKTPNRFIIGKKGRAQDDTKPSDNCKIMASDSEIYDDCQMNGSFRSQVN